MNHLRTVAAALLAAVVISCSDQEPGGPEAQPRAENTPFEYSLAFSPPDPTFGSSGVVQGIGATWSWGSSGGLVLELPVTQVGGTPFNGTTLVVSLNNLPDGPARRPEPGHYQIGPEGEAHGRAWLFDASRTWYSDLPGIFIVDQWLPDGRLKGLVALQFIREERVDSGGKMTYGATASGTFTAGASQ